ncbi:Ldh family oxidoreductase [Rhodoplanes sp. Z2-YC6860]|uniref:Ldh family oxidoreductase n=1 Tax=Rhodoplanes sp. Z2-YC6860 TaxID=674703 RepID=UPI00078D000A|nr:Ldh family oxidoreductase [Rhodoplanes sp. Z2-YC6860]AMN39580.1 malate/L-lactate dehydrogenase [Rhodoplanes sp. Z2-YC6860]
MAEAKGAPVAASAIAAFIKDAMMAVGMPDADAAKVAELMLEADLAGADAHGVFRLPQYVRRIKAGGVNPKATIKVEKTAPATAVVDGDNGMGHLVMQRAADTAIALAKDTGVAWVGARRSNHAGAAGTYAAMALPHNMVGIYSAVANANHMPAWGAAESLLSTNPIAVAVPAGEEAPVVLDIATTVVSYGTVKAYKLQGKEMPEGWMVSAKDGKPITDSGKIAEGLLMPIGGHKGSGLALVLGLLAGVLNGAAFGREVVDFNADDESECNTGHFIIALDISRFIPLDVFKAQMDRQLRDLKASKVLPGFDAIRLPGEQRRTRRAERLSKGVPVFPEVVAQLDKLAGELKIKPLER